MAILARDSSEKLFDATMEVLGVTGLDKRKVLRDGFNVAVNPGQHPVVNLQIMLTPEELAEIFRRWIPEYV